MSKKQPRKPHSPFFPGWKTVIPALCLLIVAGLLLWAFSASLPRLEVSGFRITEEEYLQAMYRARNDVLSDHAAAGISLTDWRTETALGDPCRLTMERALEILREYYAVSLLAVERGYLADAGYDAMLRDMEDINDKRQEALDAGEIVTGISQFTVNDYLTYRASSIRLQFCNDPGNPEYQVTSQQLQARYEADRDNLYRQPDSMELAFLEIENATDELEQALTALRRKALEKGGLSAALEEFPSLKVYYQEISVYPGNYSIYSRSHGDILACAAELSDGGISQVFRQDEWLCLVQCRQRSVTQYAPLEEVESIVAQSIRESRYDALITERMENTRIRGDFDRLLRFTGSKLP